MTTRPYQKYLVAVVWDGGAAANEVFGRDPVEARSMATAMIRAYVGPHKRVVAHETIELQGDFRHR